MDGSPAVPRVVIVGAGFGGLACARALAGAPALVTLVDRANHHLFTPLLYQVASSLLNPSDIASPVRSILRRGRNLRFRMAEVETVDFAARAVRTADGETIPYDWLVLAAGSRTNFFGLESVRAAALGLKDLSDAVALRNHVLGCFETAARIADPEARRPWLTFVVAGGGPTGVEYAGALSELFRKVLVRDFPELDTRRARVVLVEAADRLLGDFPPALAGYAARALAERGIEVLLGTRVTGASAERVDLAPGPAIEARTLVWAAGVRPGDLAARLDVPRTPGGRIEVGPDLRIAGRERELAIGDLAAVPFEGGILPMIAPPAMQAGRHAARNVLRAIAGEATEPFRYRDKGMMATIGRSDGITAAGRLRLTGLPGWLAWGVLHLYYLIGFRNRLLVLGAWVWHYLRFDRPIRIISWSAPPRSAGVVEPKRAARGLGAG